MNKFWQIFTFELWRNVVRKGYLFATFGLPLLTLVIFFGYPVYQNLQNNEEETSNPLAELALDTIELAGYVDYSGVFAEPSARFDDVLISYADEDAARQAMLADEIDVFFVFPEEYLATGNVVMHLPNVSISLAGDGQSLAEQLAYSTFASGLDELRLRRLSNPADFTVFNLSVNTEGSSENTEDGQFFFVYIFMMIFFLGLVLTNTYLMQTVIEERDNRLIEILISTVQPSQLLGGKILAMAVLGIAQILIWAIVMGGLFVLAGDMSAYSAFMSDLNVELRVDLLPLMAIYFVLMYLIFAAVFGTIGAVSGSAQEGSQYAGFLIMPTIIPFYFFPLLQNNPNSALAVGFSLFPITSPVTTMVRLVIIDVPMWQVIGSVVLMALTAVGAIWMAGRVFRVQTLLSGTKLKVSDLPRLIFASS